MMQTAVDKGDWEKDGFKAKPKKREKVMPEPNPLTDVKQIKLEDLPLGDLVGFTEVLANKRNEDGTVFIGYNVVIQVKDAKKPIQGWMADGDIIRLRQLTRR